MRQCSPAPSRSQLPIALLLIAALACAPSDDVPNPDGTPARWHMADATLTIGSLEDSDDALSDVASLLVTPWNEVWVLERLNAQVRVFGFDGTLLRTVGTEGDGPGEFRRPNWLGLTGDTVMVGDARLHRTTFFGADGVQAGDRPRLTLPEVPGNVTLYQVTSESAWGVLSDEMDVPYVVHYPVVRDGP